MPVLPSFGTFAPAPNLSQAYLGGIHADVQEAQLGQERQLAQAKLTQAAQQHSQALQFQREKLAQDAQQAQMEFQAKMALAQQEQLRKQQQLEMEKAYHEATIGLRTSQLDQQAKLSQARLQQASQKMIQDEAFRRDQLSQTGEYQQGMIGARNRVADAAESRVKLSADEAAQKHIAAEEIQRRIAAGEDAQQVYREVGPRLGRFPAGMLSGTGGTETVTEKTLPTEAVEARPEVRDKGLLGTGLWSKVIIPERKAVPGKPGITKTHRVPITQVPAGIGAKPARTDIPEKAIKYLQEHPETRDDFDKKYGKGASDQYLP